MVEQVVLSVETQAVVIQARLRINGALARLDQALTDYERRCHQRRDLMVAELDGYIQQLGTIIEDQR